METQESKNQAIVHGLTEISLERAFNLEGKALAINPEDCNKVLKSCSSDVCPQFTSDEGEVYRVSHFITGKVNATPRQVYIINAQNGIQYTLRLDGVKRLLGTANTANTANTPKSKDTLLTSFNALRTAIRDHYALFGNDEKVLDISSALEAKMAKATAELNAAISEGRHQRKMESLYLEIIAKDSAALKCKNTFLLSTFDSLSEVVTSKADAIDFWKWYEFSKKNGTLPAIKPREEDKQ